LTMTTQAVTTKVRQVKWQTGLSLKIALGMDPS